MKRIFQTYSVVLLATMMTIFTANAQRRVLFMGDSVTDGG